MISQFTEGLNSCGGLWDMVQSHWEIFAPVMTSAPRQPLSLEEFKQLFTISFSTSDAQLRADEEATAGHWETILTLVGGKVGGCGGKNKDAPSVSGYIKYFSVCTIRRQGRVFL